MEKALFIEFVYGYDDEKSYKPVLSMCACCCMAEHSGCLQRLIRNEVSALFPA